eukprot:SAG11_NODE_2858_length_2900_cov_1.881471_4_plen_205_part_00
MPTPSDQRHFVLPTSCVHYYCGHGFADGNSGGVLYLDSTNGSAAARSLYRRTSAAARTIEVALRPRPPTTTVEAEAEAEAVTRFLLQRTAGRLRNPMDPCGQEHHPSFPETEVEQRSKHRKIMMGLDWADGEADNEVGELGDVGEVGDEVGEWNDATLEKGQWPGGTRERIDCNPMDPAEAVRRRPHRIQCACCCQHLPPQRRW